MACCVIGGTGFIGRVVVRKLLDRGRGVRVIGRRAQAPTHLDGRAEYLSGDYGNYEFMESALDGMDEIVDLAYSTVPKSSFDDPVHDITYNLPQAVSLLQAVAARQGIRKLLIVSSGGTVYGDALNLPITEDHPTNPISPYGITKLAAEKYGLMYRRLYDLPVVIVRPGNAYGEWQLPFRGQGFIATAIATILRRGQITVFGGDQIVRDYVYVEDVADGIISAMESGRPGYCYNLGSGVGRTTNQILQLISEHADIFGYPVRIKQQPVRPFDVLMNVLDSGRLRDETGWKDAVDLREGIARAWRWYVDYESLWSV